MVDETKKEDTQTSLKTEASEEPIDYKKLLDEKDQEIAKISSDKENYRKGLLSIKRKLKNQEVQPEDDGEGETPISNEESIRTIIREELLSSQIDKAKAEKDALISKMAKELSEAKLALKNRPTSSTTAAGSNQDKLEVEQKFFSEEQLAELKAKGLDPAKVIENMKKAAK